MVAKSKIYSKNLNNKKKNPNNNNHPQLKIKNL